MKGIRAHLQLLKGGGMNLPLCLHLFSCLKKKKMTRMKMNEENSKHDNGDETQ
jgi:hypothetical protein